MLAVSSVLFGRKVGSFLPMGRLVVTVHLPSVKLIVMVKVISSSPPPVLAVRYGSPVAAAAGGEGCDPHARDPGFVTVGRGQHRRGSGGRY